MEKVRRLNGWQRLWVLICVIYLIVVSLVCYVEMPKKSSIFDKWAYDMIEVVKRNDPQLKDSPTWLIKSAYEDINDEEIIQRIRNKFENYKSEFQKIDKRYKKQLDALPSKKLKTLGVFFLFWIIPSILLYLFGWSIGWVYKGFRLDLENKRKNS
jgi:hypothetical protein